MGNVRKMDCMGTEALKKKKTALHVFEGSSWDAIRGDHNGQVLKADLCDFGRGAQQGDSPVKVLALQVSGLSSYLRQKGKKSWILQSKLCQYYLCFHLQGGRAPLTSKAGGGRYISGCQVGKHMLSRILLICPYLEILTHGTARTKNQETFPGSKTLFRLPCWLRGKESACQGRRHGFHPWPGKVSRATEQLGPRVTTLKAHVTWSCALQQEKPPKWAARPPHLESSPRPLGLEKSPPNKEDPAQPK